MATPIAVAVREALFASSGLFNSTFCGVQLRNFGASLQVDTLIGSSQLLLAGMRLLRLAHSSLDHPWLVLWFSGCLWAPGRGEPGFRGGPCPGLVVFLFVW